MIQKFTKMKILINNCWKFKSNESRNELDGLKTYNLNRYGILFLKPRDSRKFSGISDSIHNHSPSSGPQPPKNFPCSKKVNAPLQEKSTLIRHVTLIYKVIRARKKCPLTAEVEGFKEGRPLGRS